MNKILIIANYKPGTGGISGQVEKLHQCLNQEGVENAIFSVKGSFLYRIVAFFRLFKVGKQYDVFHIHTCSNFGFISAVYGVIVGRRLGKRIVLTYHGGGAESFFKKRHRLVRRYLLKTDANIVLSGFLGRVFDAYQIPYVIIPNVIARLATIADTIRTKISQRSGELPEAQQMKKARTAMDPQYKALIQILNASAIIYGQSGSFDDIIRTLNDNINYVKIHAMTGAGTGIGNTGGSTSGNTDNGGSTGDNGTDNGGNGTDNGGDEPIPGSGGSDNSGGGDDEPGGDDH